MTFFDVAPAGAFCNAISAAAKRDQQARRSDAVAEPDVRDLKGIFGALRDRIRAALALTAAQNVRAAKAGLATSRDKGALWGPFSFFGTRDVATHRRQAN